jgi:hypothetical protein
MFFTFPEDGRWNAERQGVEFGVEIGAEAAPAPVDRGWERRDQRAGLALAYIAHAHIWRSCLGLKDGLTLDNLVEARGATHRRCQINFYSRGRRTPCAGRVRWSKVWGPY